MRRSYVVPMRWMVIYEYEVSGGDLDAFVGYIRREYECISYDYIPTA
jgi:hypothetical protein